MLKLTDLPPEVFDRVKIAPHIWPRLAKTCRFGRELAKRQRELHFKNVTGVGYTVRSWRMLQVVAVLLTLQEWANDAIGVIKEYECKKRVRNALTKQIRSYWWILDQAITFIQFRHFSVFFDLPECVYKVCSYYDKVRSYSSWCATADMTDVRDRFIIVHEYRNSLLPFIKHTLRDFDQRKRNTLLQEPDHLWIPLNEYLSACPRREPGHKRAWF